jgi:chitinase
MEDPMKRRPLAIKDEYIERHDLGGAMFWSLDGDDASGTLVAALAAGLH